MNSKILITGFNGELGSKTLDFLFQKNYSIIGLDLNKKVSQSDNIELIQGSISDKDLIQSIFDDNIISEVYHFAALLSQTASKDPELATEINEHASINLINCAADHGVKNNIKVKFFFPSSIAVYGPRKIHNASEFDIIKPTTIYGINKLAVEQYGAKKHMGYDSKNYGIDFRSIRFPGVISNDSIPSGGTTDYAPQMIHAAVNNTQYICKLSKETLLPFISINKTVSSIQQLMEMNTINSTLRVFNIQETSFSVIDLYKAIQSKLSKFKVEYAIDNKFQSVADTWPSSLNCDEAKKKWNFSNSEDFEKFVTKIIDEMIENEKN
ncbi:MAG: NAD-dependent epimerase/dehydratase family protein [Candidatus Neomarinimicrobiota bacterium]